MTASRSRKRTPEVWSQYLADADPHPRMLGAKVGYELTDLGGWVLAGWEDGVGLVPWRHFQVPTTYWARFDVTTIPYGVVLDMAVTDGRVECMSLTVERVRRLRRVMQTQRMRTPKVRRFESQTPISYEQLRKIPVKRLERIASLAAIHLEKPGDLGEAFPTMDRWQELFGEPQRRRPRLDDDHYREVAEVYRSAHSIGAPPIEAVAEHFAYSKPTAARWVGKCRELGLLPPTTSGRVTT